MTNIAMEAMALLELDDFPSELNLHLFLGFSMASPVSHNQMVVVSIIPSVIHSLPEIHRGF